MAKFGKVDVLINAAGAMNAGGTSGEVEPSLWFSDFVSGSSTTLRGWERQQAICSHVFGTDITGNRKPMSKAPTTSATTLSKLQEAREQLSTWCHWAPLFCSQVCRLTLAASSQSLSWASSSILVNLSRPLLRSFDLANENRKPRASCIFRSPGNGRGRGRSRYRGPSTDSVR